VVDSVPTQSCRYPRQYHQLITEQDAIGWCHLFNGHITKHWQLYQDKFIQQQRIHTIVYIGTNWSLRTLTILWTNFFCLWKARNELIHGHDLSSQQQAHHCCLCGKMEQLHSRHDQVLASDADVFIGETPVSLETFLTMSSASHIQNWIHVWRPMIISTIKAAQDKSLQGVCTLTKYYATADHSLPHPNTGPHHPNS
jgi:hypothetical protein